MLRNFTRPIPIMLTATLIGCDQAAAPTDRFGAIDISQSAGQGSLIADIRAATVQYHDIDAAITAGYVRATPCIYNTPGSKAIHYLKGSLVNGVLDPLQPEVLLYEPMKTGKLRLVGVDSSFHPLRGCHSFEPSVARRSGLHGSAHGAIRG